MIKGWFALLVLTQLLFLSIVPVGQGNDEMGHLVRMWALTEGHFNCDKMPQAVRALEAKSLHALQSRGQPFGYYWRTGLAMSGGGQRVEGDNYECSYFPLALALPALVTRMVALDWHGEPRTGGVFLASYAARLCNLAVVDTALWLFLLLVPWAAYFALGFFSVPMVIEQSVTVGHDGTLLALALLLLATMMTRDDWRGAVVIVLLATAMTLIKPVFFGFAFLAWPTLARLTSGWRRALLPAVAAVPYLAWKLWFRLGDVQQRQWHPRFSDPERQALIWRHPQRVLGVLTGYWHYFIDDHKLPDFLPHRINGVWDTLFFANLWIDPPAGLSFFAVAGLVLALAAAALSPLRAPTLRAPWWARTAALAGAAAAIPATIFVLYLIFTPIAAPGPYGVQGRYHAVPLLTLSVLLLAAVKNRWAWPRAKWVAALACASFVAADAYALRSLWRHFWI